MHSSGPNLIPHSRLSSKVFFVSLQVLSPFIYHATQTLLEESFKDENNVLPARMREKPAIYEACNSTVKLHLLLIRVTNQFKFES